MAHFNLVETRRLGPVYGADRRLVGFAWGTFARNGLWRGTPLALSVRPDTREGFGNYASER